MGRNRQIKASVSKNGKMTAEGKCVLKKGLNGSCCEIENRECKLSSDTGKVSAELTKGASVSRHEKDFIRNGIKYVPVILERKKNAVGNSVIKKYGKE